MKRITVFAIAMFAFGSAFAQFNKGRMLVGGSAEFRTTTYKQKGGGSTSTTGTRTMFSVAPSFGYFFMDNLAAGAAVETIFSKWNSKSSSTFDYDYGSTEIQFQPFVRYYLPMGVFFQGKFGVGTRKHNPEDDDIAEYKYNTSSFALSAGYAFFLSDNVAVEPELGYRTSKLKQSDADFKNTESGLFLRVGFQIYLGKK